MHLRFFLVTLEQLMSSMSVQVAIVKMTHNRSAGFTAQVTSESFRPKLSWQCPWTRLSHHTACKPAKLEGKTHHFLLGSWKTAYIVLLGEAATISIVPGKPLCSEFLLDRFCYSCDSDCSSRLQTRRLLKVARSPHQKPKWMLSLHLYARSQDYLSQLAI